MGCGVCPLFGSGAVVEACAFSSMERFMSSMISILLISIEVEVKFNGILEFLEEELWERGCLSLLFSLRRSLAEEFPVVNFSFVVFFPTFYGTKSKSVRLSTVIRGTNWY